MRETQGGGFIDVIKDADVMAPITRCECKWGENDCPNEVFMVIVCNHVKGFTVACEPHTMNFSANVDPFDGTYSYLTPEQFDRAKVAGLYTNYNTFGEYHKAAMELLTHATSQFEEALRLGIFPR